MQEWDVGATEVEVGALVTFEVLPQIFQLYKW